MEENPMDTEHRVAELRAWQFETGQPLPLPVYDIAYCEHANLITDLTTGQRFTPYADWRDFTHRWLAEMQRRRIHPTLERLASAIDRANQRGYDQDLCLAIAKHCLTQCRASATPPARCADAAACTGPAPLTPPLLANEIGG
jgi:hypothetical protein